MTAWFRFRHFSFRLLVLLLGLLFSVLAATYLFVSRANEDNARSHSESNLEIGARVFDEAVRQRVDYLARSASIMSGDYAIRQVLLADVPDRLTLASSLKSYTQRVQAPVIALFDPNGDLLANSDVTMDNENRGPFSYLIRHEITEDRPEASGFAYLNGELHVLVVVPLYAPYPEIHAWFGLAFPINRRFADNIKATTRLEVTFVSTDDPAKPRILASTLPAATARLVARAAVDNMKHPERIKILPLPGDRYVTLFKNHEMLADAPVVVVLQRPLSAELAAAHELENSLLLISLAALAVATLAALSLARGVSQPVQALAAHTRHVAAGDYTRHLDLRRADELGQLATAFNDMTRGLAERDRVRDLLDKNVSPEVAAQLMRNGAALGGEEREVTILFADLRGFTPLSEGLPPRDLIGLLNRYLDRMSGEIERHGGVIDKFIGDAIMAVFGAPVAQDDAADRALRSALAMESALVDLNAELQAEGRPALAIGIGINTARVVAGNIGSHRRLNYSVIGDGVNVASRLQALTRTPEYHTNLLVSATTLAATRERFRTRALGEVTVKGRREAVTLFAVDGRA
ncbi:MAG: adenylate/guanylate cyclase domain-containing protein [Opitutales bacterium]